MQQRDFPRKDRLNITTAHSPHKFKQATVYSLSQTKMDISLCEIVMLDRCGYIVRPQSSPETAAAAQWAPNKQTANAKSTQSIPKYTASVQDCCPP